MAATQSSPTDRFVDSEPRPIDLPAAAKHLAAIEMEIRKGPLDPRTIHLVKLRASQINGCAFCIDMHVQEAIDDGVDERLLHLLPAWREIAAFTERDRAALALTEAVTLVSDDQVPREVWDAAAEVFGADALPYLLWQAIAINAWNRLAISTRTIPASLAK